MINIDLALQHGDFKLSINTQLASRGLTAIYGPSGAGKTTLLRWLAGLERGIAGQLSFNQQCWQDRERFVAPQQRQIAYVFQDARLFPHLDVRGNLHYAYQRRFNDQGPSLEQVCQWFGLEKLLDRATARLSGGERQRVAIARALLSSPQLILMDEPLASLDGHSKERILQHLEQLHRQLAVPILYVSHDLEEISRLADQLLLLENGTVRAQGPFLELSTRLDLPLSHQENAASIINVSIAQHDDHYQLTECAIDPQLSLLLTKIDGAIGSNLRVRIPARDVSIALQKPSYSSILNILPATIEAIESSRSARSLIRLNLAGQILLVRLTHKSIDRLKLQIGQHVYAQIKTVALLSAPEGDLAAPNFSSHQQSTHYA